MAKRSYEVSASGQGSLWSFEVLHSQFDPCLTAWCAALHGSLDLWLFKIQDEQNGARHLRLVKEAVTHA
jgi:hypothetical protein